MGIFCYFSTHSLILLIKVHISLDDDETSNLSKPMCAHYQNCYLQDEKLTLFIFLHPHAEETHYSRTCYGRPPLQPSKSGLARQVVSHGRGTYFRTFHSSINQTESVAPSHNGGGGVQACAEQNQFHVRSFSSEYCVRHAVRYLWSFFC